MQGLLAVNNSQDHARVTGKVVNLFLLSADAGIQRRVSGLVIRTSWKLQIVMSLDQMLERLSVDFIPVILADEKFPGGDWKKLIEETARLPFPPRIIIISASPGIELWEQVVLAGGYHVLTARLSEAEFFPEVFEAWQSAKRLWERRAAPKSPGRELRDLEGEPSMSSGAA